MSAQLMRVELRKVWAWYLGLLLVTLYYAILKPYPFAHNDIGLSVLAAAQGAIVAWRIFYDPMGTQSFLWSRPLTRTQLFLNRWALGLMLQGATLAILAAIIAGGARSQFHLALSEDTTAFYPASRWFDLAGLWPCLVYGLLAYHAALYFNVFAEFKWRQLGGAVGGTFRRTVVSAAALCLPVGLFLLVDIPPRLAPKWPYGVIALLAAALIALTTTMAIHMYRQMEVDS